MQRQNDPTPVSHLHVVSDILLIRLYLYLENLNFENTGYNQLVMATVRVK